MPTPKNQAAVSALTVADLHTFANELPALGRLTVSQCQQFSTALRAVFGTVGVEPGIRLADLDFDSVFADFGSAKPDLADSTRSTYKTVIRRCVRLLIAHTRGDANWWRSKPTAKRRTGKNTTGTAASTQQATAPQTAPTDTLAHRFPLRAGLTVDFSLPADLSQGEAARLGAYLQTLVL